VPRRNSRLDPVFNVLMKSLLLALMVASLIVAANARDKNKAEGEDTLRKYADQLGWRIATGIKPKSWEQDEQGREILAREFNATMEMGMMNSTQLREGQFDFSRMDRTIRFAKDHNMKIWGAALIYRADSLAPWMQERMHLGPRRAFTPQQLDDLMRKQIQTVVRHGGDAFYAWGVVNEPLSGRNQPWQTILGEEDYIAKAFRYAREATKSDLVLNETFGHTGLIKERVDRFFELVERLKSKGVPIDGVGTEMHLEAPLDPDYLDQFHDFLQRAKKNGVAVYITEMDVYQGSQGAVPNASDNQKKIYHDVTATCLADSNCKGMTIWDLSDKDTWLANKKRNAIPDAKPDLFDEAHQKKPAYYGVLEALKERVAKK